MNKGKPLSERFIRWNPARGSDLGFYCSQLIPTIFRAALFQSYKPGSNNTHCYKIASILSLLKALSDTTKYYNFTKYFTEILLSLFISYCRKEYKVPLNSTQFYNVILNEHIIYRDT